jgi:site-specific DNA recombinase
MVWEDQIGTATSIIDRIATHKDRLVVSLNLAAITEPEAAQTPIPATFEIPFQKRQNGCAKPIIIAADNAPQ